MINTCNYLPFEEQKRKVTAVDGKNKVDRTSAMRVENNSSVSKEVVMLETISSTAKNVYISLLLLTSFKLFFFKIGQWIITHAKLWLTT